MEILLPLAVRFVQNLDYRDATSTRKSQGTHFKKALESLYGRKESFGYCMLTKKWLPRELVVASHLFRFSWRR
jgi:hypothetical protein